MKILYITTIGGTMNFFRELIKKLIEDGHKVDIACNNTGLGVSDFFKELGCNVHNLSVSRSPLNMGNLRAISEIKKIVEGNDYDIVHCHTPVAAACTRLACRTLRKKGVKVFYTAHGFHFYDGAPLKNWLIYYPVEKLCAYFTDVLVTINQEDYNRAKKKLKAKKVAYVPGVGVDIDKFNIPQFDKNKKRQELGIPANAMLLFSVGELNENKNHETIIRAISDMPVYYMIAGTGEKKEALLQIAESLGISDRVKLLGFRKDMGELYGVADVFVFPSFREGLSVSLMEAMASGLPCAVSKIRGNVDLIDESGGVYFNPHSLEDCKVALEKLLSSNLRELGEKNKGNVKKFSLEKVTNQMFSLYEL